MTSNFKTPEGQESLRLNAVDFTFLDIKNVVENFYTQVAVDPVLKVPFSTVDDWPHHIDRLTHFWWTRFGGDAYMDATYNPPEKHFLAGFNQVLLSHWLELFHRTLKSTLNPAQAQLWGSVADRMGVALNAKNEAYIEAHKAMKKS